MTQIELIENILHDLVEAHQQLLKLSEEKRSTIIKGNIGRLSEIVREEGKVVKHIGKLEEERIYAVNQLLDINGISSEGVTMTDLAKLMPSSKDKAQFLKLQSDLHLVLEQIKKLNDLNQELLQTSLKFVNHSIDLFMEPETNQPTYGNPTGQTTQQQRRGIFDTKA